MVGIYLLFIKEYASAKTEAVTPEPQENTIFVVILSPKVFLNTFKISFSFLNVLSSLIRFPKGIHIDFGIDPLLMPFLGSSTLPSNLSLLLASIPLNYSLMILSLISLLFLTKFFLSDEVYLVGLIFVIILVTGLFSDFHFFSPPFKT